MHTRTQSLSLSSGNSDSLAGVLSPAQIDAMVSAAGDLGEGRHGVEELLSQMTKAVLERALETEISDFLGYGSGDPASAGSGNSRNGKTTKQVHTLQWPVEVTVPRDRNSSFEPVIVPKRARRLAKVGDMILSLYARGMTTRDIGSRLEEIHGASLGPRDNLPDGTALVVPVVANPATEILERLAANQSTGATAVSIQRTYPLEEAPTALASFAAGKRGKLVIIL